MLPYIVRRYSLASRRTKRNLRTLLAIIFIFLVFVTIYITSTDFETVPVSPKKQFEKNPQISLKDWHDYDQMRKDAARKGNGEGGLPYHLPEGQADKKQALYRVNGFNALGSDSISLDRSVKDIRHKGCHKKLYLNRLPTVSVIIPFHNEHLSTLLRSVHSIINRSPTELLKEVVLADDLSDKDFLGAELDLYVKEHWPERVRIVRATQREGLIRARLMGAREAKGDTLLFLDSHSECNHNWLPPILEPIAKDRKTAVCPFVDVIDFETFEYRAQDEGARGAFDWELYYKRLPLLPESLKHPTEPFDDPVMAGGYFAIDREWFWELGGYDEGLDIWGGEQYELSFKLWQCGGKLVDAPCSRVGHIYRKFSPFPSAGKGDYIGRNYKRVAEVWMDEFKEFIYERRPHYRRVDPGDLTKQKALRTKLNCKTFRWFMTEIAFDLPKKYPPIEPPNKAEGDLRPEVAKDLCVDTRFKGQNSRFELQPCIRGGSGQGGEQFMNYRIAEDIHPRKRHMCFDVSTSHDRSPIVLFPCHGQKGNQHWKYRLKTKHLYHPVTGMCLDCDPERLELFMRQCDDSSDSQRWIWQKLQLNATVKPF